MYSAPVHLYTSSQQLRSPGSFLFCDINLSLITFPPM